MRGRSRPKDGVATLAYDPAIHEAFRKCGLMSGYHSTRGFMDARVKARA